MPVVTDFVFNGQGSGSVAERLLASNFDPNTLRPWTGKDGRTYIAVNTGQKDSKTGQPIYRAMAVNAPSTLRKNEWIYLDEAVLQVQRTELRAWQDVVNAGLTFNVPGGMGKTVIQHQTTTDAGNAMLSMDGLNQAQRDRPVFDLVNLPLPITHGDFSFSAREIQVSRQNGTGLDLTMVEDTTRRVLEINEGLLAGTLATYSYGGGTIYGYRNHPNRVTFTPTLPTAAGWDGNTLVTELLAVLQTLSNNLFRGPVVAYFSRGWDQYLDRDYTAAYNTGTIRNRVKQIERIQDIRMLDILPDFEIILVTMVRNTVEAVQAMPLQTLQWESHGGMQLNFKVMCIRVPRIRANANGNTGVAHGVAA